MAMHVSLCYPTLFFSKLKPTTISSHYHSWRLTGLLVFVSIIFVAGFIVRELGAYDMDNLVKYIVSIVLIYIAP